MDSLAFLKRWQTKVIPLTLGKHCRLIGRKRESPPLAALQRAVILTLNG